MTSAADAEEFAPLTGRAYYERVCSIVTAGLDELSISSGTTLTLRPGEPGPDGWRLMLEARSDDAPGAAVLQYERIVLEPAGPDMDAETQAVVFLSGAEEKLAVERDVLTRAAGHHRV